MKSTDYGGKNPLRCPVCDEYRYLDFKGVRFCEGNKAVGITIPFLECHRCNTPPIPVVLFPKMIVDDAVSVEKYYKEIANEHLAKISNGELLPLNSKIENKIFEKYNLIGFKYDSWDYYCIPGLYTPWNEGFLTPVYFSKCLLLYYNNHPDYKVKFASTSKFNIFNKFDKALVNNGFGINRKGNIICWLGDLENNLIENDNEFHRKQFLLFNVDSDHDVISDYYFNQIEANFTSSDSEIGILECRNIFDENVKIKFKLTLTKFDIDKLFRDYKSPIVDELYQVESSYVKLNALLVESINVADLKKFLINRGVNPKTIIDLKGLKLFEKFVKQILNVENASEMVSPLYILYDLRLLAGHIRDVKYDDKLKSCKDRLNLKEEVTNLEVYMFLCQRIKEMYEKLIRILIVD